MKKQLQKGILYFLGIMIGLTALSRTIHYQLLPKVSTTSKGSGMVMRQFRLDGSIGFDTEALKKNQVVLSSNITGLVTKVNVKEGQTIVKGQTLMNFEVKEDHSEDIKRTVDERNTEAEKEGLQKQKQAVEKEIGRLQAELSQKQQLMKQVKEDGSIFEKEQSLETLKQQIEANESLYAAGAISKSECDSLKRQYELTQKQLEDLKRTGKENSEKTITELQEKITAQQNSLIELEEKIKVCDNNRMLYQKKPAASKTLVASVSGKIYKLSKNQGSSVNSGEELVTIVPAELPYTLFFHMTAEQAKQIKKGDEISYTSGKVESTALVKSKTYDKESDDYEIAAQLKPEDLAALMADDLKNGQENNLYKAKVALNFNSQSYNLVVPSSAVINENGNYYIYTLKEIEGLWGKQYKAQKQAVKVLEEGDTSMAVEGDIEEGDQIIIYRSKSLEDGQEVALEG